MPLHSTCRWDDLGLCPPKKFAPKIERYIKAIQYEKEKLYHTEVPQIREMTVEEGELIGYSGNTGVYGTTSPF